MESARIKSEQKGLKPEPGLYHRPKPRVKAVMLIALMMLLTPLAAQNSMTYREADSSTYTAYMQGRWETLIKQGRQARRAGISYYYLNYRLGMASFMTGDYMMAAVYLEEALNQNPLATSDSLLMKSLLYAYLYSRQYSKAEDLKPQVSSVNSSPRYTKTVMQLYTEGGSSLFNTLGDRPFDEKLYYAYKEVDLFKSMKYFNVDVQGYLNPTLSYQLAYSQLQLSRTRFFKEYTDTLQLDYTAIQQYLYGGLSWHLNDYLLSISVNLPLYRAHTLMVTGYDSLSNRNLYDTLTERYANPVVYGRIGRSYRHARLGLHGSWARFGADNSWQAGADLSYYPRGNDHLYSFSSATGRWQKNVAYFVFEQKIGARLHRYLWLEMQLLWGDLQNYNSAGYYLFNTPDKLMALTGLILLVPLSPKLEIDLSLQNLYKQNTMQTFPSFVNKEIVNSYFEFQQFNIIGGIKWKF